MHAAVCAGAFDAPNHRTLLSSLLNPSTTRTLARLMGRMEEDGELAWAGAGQGGEDGSAGAMEAGGGPLRMRGAQARRRSRHAPEAWRQQDTARLS